MGRLIDADGLNETLAIVAKKFAKSDAQQALMGRVMYIIDHKPTIEAEPVVHGRWIGVHDGWGCCSNCRRIDSIERLATHCRYCGAKMT